MRIHTQPLVHHLRRLVSPAAGAETDAALLDRFVRHHDETAFTALVQRHGALVLGVCRRLLGNHQDAEDAAQATFLVLARKAASLKTPGSLAAFLHGVARRLALKCLRANSRRRQREKHSVPAASSAPDPLDELTARELLVILDEEVARLPEAYRLPLILCCLESRTQEEAARQLGWTVGSVKGRLERGRARLHARLMRRGLTLPAALLALQVTRGALTACTAPLGQATIHAILAATGAGLSAQALVLADSGLKGVALSQWKVGLGLLLLAGVLVAGAGGLARPTATPRSPEAERTPQTDTPRPAQADLHGDPLPPEAVARMGTVRFRQGGMLAFLPDGKTLFSGGFGNWSTVRLWQVPSGKELRRFAAKKGLVYSIALSPDGKLLATGLSEEGRWEVSLSEVATGKERHRFRGLNTSADVLAFSPKGNILAIAVGTLVRLVEPTTGKLLDELHAEGQLRALAFAPDGKVLATGGYNGSLTLWDVSPGSKRGSLQHGDVSYAIAFSPDGKWVVSGGKEGTIRVWDATSRTLRRKLAGRLRGVHSLVFSPDGKTLFAGTYDGCIQRWEIGSFEELHPLEGHQGPVRALAFSRDGKLLASESEDFTVRLWDPATGKERTQTQGHQGQVYSAAFSPDGKTVASGGYYDRTLRLWDAATGRELRRFTGHQDGVLSVAFAPDGKTIASGGAEKDSTIRLWNPVTGQQRHRLKGQGRIEHLAFSPDGRLLASIDWGRGIRLWDAEGRTVDWLSPQRSCRGLAFSPDGKVLVSCCDGEICLFDVATGKELRRFGPVPRNTSRIAFSPDGLTLATGSDAEWPEHEGKVGGGGAGAARPPAPDYSRTLCLWDVNLGREIHCLKGPQEHIRSVTFSPDGHTLAAGTSEGSIYLWETFTGQERHRLVGHQNTVSTLAFARDGQRLLSGSYDTTLLVWKTAAAEGRQEPLTTRQRDRLWDELAATDTRTGYRAVQVLAGNAAQTVAYLEEHLRREGQPIGARVAALVVNLDSDDFAVREEATRKLEQLGAEATGALRRALQEKPSPEVRRRIAHLLQRRAAAPPTALRIVRAVEVLEIIGSPEARDALRRLAERRPQGRATEEARGALARLAQRAVRSP